MLWIVGKTFSEFRKYLEDKGVDYGIFWDASLPLPEDVTAPVVQMDFQDIASLNQQLDSANASDVTAIIVAGYENYVLPAAYIARYFGVPGPSIEAAHAATDKSIMRSRFIAFDPALSPDYAEVQSWEEIEEFMRTHSFPVMLKPASLMKSLLITKSTTTHELELNYRQTIAEVSRLYDKYNIGQPPKIIIEEFLSGSMHTVAAFADKEGKPVLIPGIVDCVTGQEIGHNDNFLFSRTLPTRLSPDDQQAVLDVAAKGIEALGLTSCPAHVEIILTAKGPKIIEIGARIGGYRPRMYEYAFGIDLQQIMLDIAENKSPNIETSADRSIAVYEIFPDKEGAFRELTHLQELETLPSLRHLSIKADESSAVGRSSLGYKASAVIILGHEDPAQFAKDTEFVRENVKISLSR